MKDKLLVPYTFVLMNWAAVVSLYHFLRSGTNIHRQVWVMPSPAPISQDAAGHETKAA